MLTYISVKNFAIIENIEVNFNEGMTSLTGETGAGKSLLIDAIGLLLGDRATSNVVRTGSNKAEIEGIFTYQNSKIDDILNELDIEHNNELIIRRQITPSNNNIIKINNHTVSLKDLKSVTGKLADIHTQMDTHRLINPLTYLDIIDGFTLEQTEKALAEYHHSLKVYKDSLKELKRLESSNNDLNERLDLMRYQKKELESYQLDLEEVDELEKSVEELQNFDRIFQTLKQVYDLIDQTNAIDTLYDVSKELETVEAFNDTYKTIKERFSNSYYELDDTFSELKEALNGLDFDSQLLDDQQTRLNSLYTLQKKYRKDIPELISYLQKITIDIDNIDHYDDILVDQDNVVKEHYDIVLNKAMKITKIREKTAQYIEKELLAILFDLELSKTNFKVAFSRDLLNDHKNSSLFTENGIDEVDFLLTTNIGEPLKSLSKSASGGEMSRIMLGFKNLLTKSLGLSLIIFDEIDTGVSGYIANQVAKKMKEISSNTQVICITHIPQVASISDHHLRISKSVEDNRTKAHVETLNGDFRVREIAEMISGEHITEATLQSAKELLMQ